MVTSPRAWSVLVLVSLAVDVALKSPADRGELMWACYWASCVAGIGMLLRSPLLVAGGVIFFGGLGCSAWIVSTFMDGRTEVTSILIHIVPLLAGFFYISQFSRLPVYSGWVAWLLFVVPFTLSWKICAPDAMINRSHWTRWPVPTLIPGGWPVYLTLLLMTGVLVWIAASAFRHMLQHARTNARPVNETSAGNLKDA